MTETYCNWTHDGYLCWPPTLAGDISEQTCVQVYPSAGYSGNLTAFRECGLDGKWIGRDDNDMNPNGWTNYTPCFPPVIQTLLKKVYDGDAKHKFLVADVTRIIEIIGFTSSFLSLTASLMILMKFTSLKNQRTSIHANLFAAMNIQVLLRLILYFDQAFMRRTNSLADYLSTSAIEKLPRLCISMYIMLEYFVTAMFNWMLNEGISLNIIVTNKVLRGNFMNRYYYLIGWFVPLCITIGWITVAGPHYANDTTGLRCWYGYNFRTSYWLMQGPRLGVIVVNMGFLLNIMRVLVSKLQGDPSSDIIKARKAAKAAIILLPLLGITNILSMFEGPVAGPAWHFATWSYITHFLRSFQGTFVAWLYCLATQEVYEVLTIAAHNRMSIFRYRHPVLARMLYIRGRREIEHYPRLHPSNTRGRFGTDEMPMRAMSLQGSSEPHPVTCFRQSPINQPNMGINFGSDNVSWRRRQSQPQSPDGLAIFQPEFINISADGRLITSSEPIGLNSEIHLATTEFGPDNPPKRPRERRRPSKEPPSSSVKMAKFGQDNPPKRPRERRRPSEEPSTSSVIHSITAAEFGQDSPPRERRRPSEEPSTSSVIHSITAAEFGQGNHPKRHREQRRPSEEPSKPSVVHTVTVAEFGQDSPPKRPRERRRPSEEPSTSSVIHSITAAEFGQDNHPKRHREQRRPSEEPSTPSVVHTVTVAEFGQDSPPKRSRGQRRPSEEPSPSPPSVVHTVTVADVYYSGQHHPPKRTKEQKRPAEELSPSPPSVVHTVTVADVYYSGPGQDHPPKRSREQRRPSEEPSPSPPSVVHTVTVADVYSGPGQDHPPKRTKEQRRPAEEPSISSVIHSVTVAEINRPRGVSFDDNVEVYSIPRNKSPKEDSP